MKGNKGKKIIAALTAVSVVAAGAVGGAAIFNAASTEEPGAGKSYDLNTYKFFDSQTDDSVEDEGSASYKDGYWGKQGISYRPLWTAEHTASDGTTGRIVLEPVYFRTSDGKVAYCIDAAKDIPTHVEESDELVSKKAYAVVKAGYPGNTGRSDASDIELEWATVWAVKKVTGNTKTFDDYRMSSKTVYKAETAKTLTRDDLDAAVIAGKSDEEVAALLAEAQKTENERVEKLNAANKEAADKAKADAERIRTVAEGLANVSEVEYDKYAVNDSEAKVVHENGVYKAGPYRIDQNIGANTTVKLVDAPANATVIEENGAYYVTIPETSITRDVSFKMEFTGDKQMLAATVYYPESDQYQRIFVYDMVDAKADVTVKVDLEISKGGQIRFIKMDEDGNKTLEGVEFEIYNSRNELVDTVKTNEKGEAVSKVLPYGSYTAVESKTLDGYMLSKEVMKITLNESSEDISLVTRTVTNKKNSVTILKVDSKTNKALEGASLSVKDVNGKEVFAGKTDKEGKITMVGLAAGKYTVSEKEAPAGYAKTDEVISFTVDEYGAVTGTTTLKNEALKGVVIKKVGSDDKSKGLEGAEIEVYDSTNTVVLKGTTDKNGELAVDALAPGKYTFVEVKAPSGYALNNQKYSFEVTENGEVKGTLEIVDNPIVVEIKKTDNDGKALEGAQFTVKNDKNETVFVGKTNSNGILKVEKIVPGTYTVTETAPPAGYKINSKSFSFKVDENGKVEGTTTIKDEITVVTITKKDKADGKVLEGAKITIKDKNGKVVANGTTDKEGKFVVKGLAPGTYVYTEDEAPEGYVKTNEKATFTINAKGDDVNLTLYNSKLNLTSSSTTTNKTNTTTTSTKTTVNSNGEIVKTGADDTTQSAMPIYLAVAAIVVAIAAVGVILVKKNKKTK